MSAAPERALRADAILLASRSLLRGDHFVYTNGDHGEGWVSKDAIFPNTEWASELCALLAEALAPRTFDIVCGPATGGLIVSLWTAHHLRLPWVFAERSENQFVLGRGYDRMVAGQRVLVVDDVVNTGHSIVGTVAAVRAAGGEVTTAATLCTRGNATAAGIGCAEFVYVTEVQIPTWPASECELCRSGVPVNTEFAHGAEFIAAQRITY